MGSRWLTVSCVVAMVACGTWHGPGLSCDIWESTDDADEDDTASTGDLGFDDLDASTGSGSAATEAGLANGADAGTGGGTGPGVLSDAGFGPQSARRN